jgi:DNA-binding IclR family transcriptional regulator
MQAWIEPGAPARRGLRNGTVVAIPKQGAQTFGHGISVLMLLADAQSPIGLSEVARRLELHKNAAYRLLNELEGQGLVDREPDGRRYVVGAPLIGLAAKLMRKVSLGGLARPAMERLRDLTGETLSLHVRQGDSRVCVDVAIGTHQISRFVRTGETRPLFSGPSGKVQLAYLDSENQSVIIENAAEAGDDADVLRQQVSHTRELGYYASIGDLTPGVSVLSSPIFDAAGVVASLTVSGPGDRLTEARMAAIAEALISECAHISEALGYLSMSNDIPWPVDALTGADSRSSACSGSGSPYCGR